MSELRVSARGWNSLQLAVIGFIGLCGVLQDGRPDNPMWLQAFAVIMVLAALAIACLATFLVALVAWPLYGGRQPVGEEEALLERDSRRLKRGLALTFVALAVLALATASGWWPQNTGAQVSVQARDGQSWCGTLADASPGSLGITADGEAVVVALQDVAAVVPVDGC